jgi:cell division protease FtsH
MNEAAILTARAGREEITMATIEEAITRVVAGPEKKSKLVTEKDRKLVAYHEAGHAIVSCYIPECDKVHEITTIPRGQAGGYTMYLPKEEINYVTRGRLKARIASSMGGRVAEALVLGDISTGASNDLERATKMAHEMVTKYGMSEAIGPLNYSSNDEVFLGRDFTSKQNYSEELASKIDKEVRSIIDKAYKDAEQLLKDHREELDRVAQALLEMETLDSDEFEAVYSGTKTVEELKSIDDEKAAARKVVEDAEAKARAEREAREAAEAALMAGTASPGKRVAVLDEKGNVRRIVPGSIRQLNKTTFSGTSEKKPEEEQAEAQEDKSEKEE